MKLELALLVGLFVLGFAMSASAGAVADADGDLVPDQFDNCSTVANGPNPLTNQVDSDLDGYGNRCDTDYDNFLNTSVADFGPLLVTFGTNSFGETDHDGSGTITVVDFAVYLAKFQSPPRSAWPVGSRLRGHDALHALMRIPGSSSARSRKRRVPPADLVRPAGARKT